MSKRTFPPQIRAAHRLSLILALALALMLPVSSALAGPAAEKPEQNHIVRGDSMAASGVDATPVITFDAPDDLICSRLIKMKIDFSDVTDLYGYQFEVTYDNTLVNAVGAFDNSWFDTTSNALITPGWNATCSAGVCKFGVAKVNPGTPISGGGRVAEITFSRLATGTFTAAIKDPLLSGIDGTAILPLDTSGATFDFIVCSSAIIRCDPMAASGVVGESNAVVDMYIENATELYGVDLRVSFFDTSIAQVVDQNLGQSGVQIEPLYTWFSPDFTVRNEANNTAGTARFVSTQVNPTMPVNGSGSIARITFTGLQPGTFTMTWGAIELASRNGQILIYTTQSCTVTFTSPLAVTLNDFSAQQVDDFVRVTWETASELDNRGFNLYRGVSPDGWDRQLNAALIPSQGQGSSTGFVYTWDDHADLEPNTSYFYWLEDVSISGSSTMHGPVSVIYMAPTAVTVGEMQATPVASAALPLAAALLALLAPLAAAGLRRRTAD